MVSVVKTAEDKEEAEERLEQMLGAPRLPDVPYGLQISLDGCTLDKLGVELDDGVKPGDVIHMKIFAEVTCVSMRKSSGAPDDERLELSITDITFFENETTEKVYEGRETAEEEAGE